LAIRIHSDLCSPQRRLQNPSSLRPDPSRLGGSQDASERGALHVAGGWTGSRVPKSVAHCAESADRPVQLVGLSPQHLSVDTWQPVRREHARHLIK
jgi:hypothetical protein